MGTVLEATLHGRDRAEALEALFALAARLDRLLSLYQPESDLVRLNRSAGAGPVAVAPELAELVARALDLSRATGGSFDVTVGPLVALWSEAARRGALPEPEELARARALVGARHVRVGPGARVELLRPGVSLDLGGVAKGFALDRMLPLLAERGVESALLSFGQSSAWALGAPPGASSWGLLARAPGGGFLGVLHLRDLALSVSGSLSQFSEIGGRSFGHILDPRSGWPLERRREALVVAPRADLAEALSKALLVGGEAEGLARVEAEPGCEGLLADADGRVWTTSGFEALVAWEPLKRDPGPSDLPPDG
jgi:thiamine biosynthesis lipoprotein